VKSAGFYSGRLQHVFGQNCSAFRKIAVISTSRWAIYDFAHLEYRQKHGRITRRPALRRLSSDSRMWKIFLRIFSNDRPWCRCRSLNFRCKNISSCDWEYIASVSGEQTVGTAWNVGVINRLWSGVSFEGCGRDQMHVLCWKICGNPEKMRKFRQRPLLQPITEPHTYRQNLERLQLHQLAAL